MNNSCQMAKFIYLRDEQELPRTAADIEEESLPTVMFLSSGELSQSSLLPYTAKDSDLLVVAPP